MLLNEIAERYKRLDDAIRKGKLNLPKAISSYAWLARKDLPPGTLVMANSGAAQVNKANDAEASIPFIISVYQEDRDGDVVVPTGCRTHNYVNNPVIFFGHQDKPIPIAKAMSPQGQLHVFADNQMIQSTAFFDQADEDAMFIHGKVKRGFLSASSIAFVPMRAHRREMAIKAHPHEGDPGGWVFEEIDMTEWSIVGVPSNPGATVIERDLRGGLRDEVDRERRSIRPHLLKALEPYCAKSINESGGCWTGWCPPVKTKTNGSSCSCHTKQVKTKALVQADIEHGMIDGEMDMTKKSLPYPNDPDGGALRIAAIKNLERKLSMMERDGVEEQRLQQIRQQLADAKDSTKPLKKSLKRGKTLNEGSGSDGGYLVPQQKSGIDQHYDEGYVAAHAGKPRSANPYHRSANNLDEDDAAQDWDMGWQDGAKERLSRNKKGLYEDLFGTGAGVKVGQAVSTPKGDGVVTWLKTSGIIQIGLPDVKVKLADGSVQGFKGTEVRAKSKSTHKGKTMKYRKDLEDNAVEQGIDEPMAHLPHEVAMAQMFQTAKTALEGMTPFDPQSGEPNKAHKAMSDHLESIKSMWAGNSEKDLDEVVASLADNSNNDSSVGEGVGMDGFVEEAIDEATFGEGEEDKGALVEWAEEEEAEAEHADIATEETMDFETTGDGIANTGEANLVDQGQVVPVENELEGEEQMDHDSDEILERYETAKGIISKGNEIRIKPQKVGDMRRRCQTLGVKATWVRDHGTGVASVPVYRLEGDPLDVQEIVSMYAVKQFSTRRVSTKRAAQVLRAGGSIKKGLDGRKWLVMPTAKRQQKQQVTKGNEIKVPPRKVPEMRRRAQTLGVKATYVRDYGIGMAQVEVYRLEGDPQDVAEVTSMYAVKSTRKVTAKNLKNCGALMRGLSVAHDMPEHHKAALGMLADSVQMALDGEGDEGIGQKALGYLQSLKEAPDVPKYHKAALEHHSGELAKEVGEPEEETKAKEEEDSRDGSGVEGPQDDREGVAKQLGKKLLIEDGKEIGEQPGTFWIVEPNGNAVDGPFRTRREAEGKLSKWEKTANEEETKVEDNADDMVTKQLFDMLRDSSNQMEATARRTGLVHVR